MILRYTTPGGTAVTLESVKLTGFSVDNQFDGEAFNRSGRRETISGTAIITGNPLTSSTGSIDTIRNSLNTPRGKLELAFTSAPSTFYVLADGRDAATSNYDARNGPLPHVSVSRIEGNHSTAVTFVSFSFTYFGCGDTRIQKFEMAVTNTLDEAGFITMTRTGSLRVSGKKDIANPAPYTTSTPAVIPSVANVDVGQSPDLYRNLIAGKPGPFFRRIRQDYTLDASLTTLSFTIEDRMVFRELKYPVMMGDASFQYERTLGGGLAMMGQKTFSCHFEGEPDTPPNLLLAIAIEAAMARIDFAKDLVQSLTVKEPNIYSRNRIELSVTAVGQSDKPVDPTVVRDMFTDPHTTGDTRYVSAYPSGGGYIETVSGLRWDPCYTPTIITTIVENNPDDGSATESTLTIEAQPPDGELKPEDGEDDMTPLTPDPAYDEGEGAGRENIKHLDGQQDFDTQDTGMRLLEATGGSLQWPFQIRMPQVVVTQTVKYISNTRSSPVPYPEISDPFVVLSERVSVNNAPPDATGKSVFAVVAVRNIQIQTSASTNTSTNTSDLPRRVWAPNVVPQARGLFTSRQSFNNLQMDQSGNATRGDYTSRSGT